MNEISLGTIFCAAFLVFSTAETLCAETYFEDRERGWFWYEISKDRDGRKTPQRPVTVKDIRKRGEKLFETALLFPSRENVKAYMEHQKLLFERSEEFARVWKRVLWETPELDSTVDNPVNAAGAEISKRLREKAEDGMIERISRVGSLVFFFRSDCPFCRGQAEIVKTLEKKHGIGVVAASLDGKGLFPLYPDFTDGETQARRLGVHRVPAIFLFVPSRAKIARIGTGYLTLGEIRRRLHVVGKEILDRADPPEETGKFSFLRGWPR